MLVRQQQSTQFTFPIVLRFTGVSIPQPDAAFAVRCTPSGHGKGTGELRRSEGRAFTIDEPCGAVPCGEFVQVLFLQGLFIVVVFATNNHVIPWILAIAATWFGLTDTSLFSHACTYVFSVVTPLVTRALFQVRTDMACTAQRIECFGQ